MQVAELRLPGLKLVLPEVHADSRGFFVESYSESRYRDAGIGTHFVQDNHSRSARDILRGLHYQLEPKQEKLVRVARGRVFDVAVDLRVDSPTFGQWQSVYLDDE